MVATCQVDCPEQSGDSNIEPAEENTRSCKSGPIHIRTLISTFPHLISKQHTVEVPGEAREASSYGMT